MAGSVADGSSIRLADILVDSATSPSQRLLGEEQRLKLRDGLSRLAPIDREVLVMYYLEELAFTEIAAILEISESAAKVRHFRGLGRIRKLIDSGQSEGSP